MAKTLESFISLRQDETQTDYTYRLLGSAEEWLPLVKHTTVLEGIAKSIWDSYTEIKKTPTKDLEEDWDLSYYSDDRKRDDVAGAYCRTWCRLARNELDFRDGCDPEDDEVIDEDEFMRLWENVPGIKLEKTETGGFIFSFK